MRPTLVTIALTLTVVSAPLATAQAPTQEKPTITVAAFEFGAVQTVRYASAGRYGRVPGEYGQASTVEDALGIGASDLIVEKLIASERFRVFERKQLDAVLREQKLSGAVGDTIARARYIVTGSISFLGGNDRDMSGVVVGFASAALFRGLAHVRTSESSMKARLTARVVDTRSGEIIGSATSEGRSDKRWSFGVFGAGAHGIGGVNAGDRNFRESAIGEAMDRAATALVEQVIAMRATSLKP